MAENFIIDPTELDMPVLIPGMWARGRALCDYYATDAMEIPGIEKALAGMDLEKVKKAREMVIWAIEMYSKIARKIWDQARSEANQSD